MGKFINPFTDWGFKRLFGQEITKDLLIHFLNSLLKGERTITDLTFKDKERLGELKENRGIIYDIYCTTDTGEHIIVEMQNRKQKYFVERSVYYASRAISSQGEKDKWDYRLTPVYTICFLNYKDLDSFPHKFRTDLALTDLETHEMVTDCERFVYLSLPLFEKTEDECDTMFACWIYVLKHMELLDRIPFTARNAVFKKLENISNLSALTKEERELYDESLKAMRDNYAIRKTDIEETQKKIISSMRAKGLSEELICEIMELTPEEIVRIMKE